MRVEPVLSLAEKLHSLHKEMSITQILVLMMVARHGRITQWRIHNWLGIKESTASRVISLMSTGGRGAVKGLGLIERSVSEEDGRDRILSLTEAGRRVFEEAGFTLTETKEMA